MNKLRTKPHSTSNWNTKGGNFQINRTVNCQFSLPEFIKHREVKWTMYVDKTKKSKSLLHDYWKRSYSRIRTKHKI